MRGFLVTFGKFLSIAFMVVLMLGLGSSFIMRSSEPSMTVYENKQAEIIARSLSQSINAMATVEEGTIERFLVGEWDISVKGREITVSHEKFKGTDEALADVQDASLEGARRLYIVKEPGKPVSLRSSA
jgi:hypothetical protein